MNAPPLKNFSGQHFEIPSVLEAVGPVREAFCVFLYECGLSPETVGPWELLFSEAVVNAIEHGNGNDPTKRLQGCWWASEGQVCLEVADEGCGPPREKVSHPQLPEDAMDEGGRGLFLMATLADRWEHWRSTDGYRARLIRFHPELSALTASQDDVLNQTMEELSTCFESLAAFYRLGEGLVHAENVSRFINRAFQDLATVARHDFLQLTFTQDFQPALVGDLATAPHVSQNPLSERQKRVVTKADELVWESAEEVADDPLLGTFSCGICSPVQAGGVRQGLLTVARFSNEPYFNAGELNTIRTFADLIGIAVVSANNTLARSREARALRELEIASEMQASLLPLPTLCAGEGWQIFARREGAREVAGDHLEVALLDSGQLYLVCIDVMGKGVAAAFLAAIFRTAFHLSIKYARTLPDLADKLNRVLIQQMGELTMFATCSIARISPDLDEVEVLNAGHCPVVIGRVDGSLVEVQPSGPPLGLFSEVTYEVERLPLAAGDVLLMVTDGLYEWENGPDIWGWEAFLDFFRNHRRLSAERFWSLLCAEMDSQCGEGAEASDDRTLLYWRRTR